MSSSPHRQSSSLPLEELDAADPFNIIQRRLSRIEAVQQAQTSLLSQLAASLERATAIRQAQQTQEERTLEVQQEMVAVLEKLADHITPMPQETSAVQNDLRTDHLAESAQRGMLPYAKAQRCCLIRRPWDF